MPLDKSTVPSEEELETLGGGDPDNPVDDREFVGTHTITALVNIGTGSVIPSYGVEDNERIIAMCRKYAEKAGNYQYSVWFLEAEGISVVRTDGVPWRQHEIIKVQSKDGKNLGKNMTHGLLAAAFNEHGLSASYTKAGADDSTLGRTFKFVSHTFKLGKTYTKDVNLFPAELFPEGYAYDGEVREVTPKTQEDDSVPADGGASSVEHINELEAIGILMEILNGKRPEDMLDIIIGDARLRRTPSVFGVPLIESATDESLAQVLIENKAMILTGGGVLQMAPAMATV